MGPLGTLASERMGLGSPSLGLGLASPRLRVLRRPGSPLLERSLGRRAVRLVTPVDRLGAALKARCSTRLARERSVQTGGEREAVVLFRGVRMVGDEALKDAHNLFPGERYD